VKNLNFGEKGLYVPGVHILDVGSSFAKFMKAVDKSKKIGAERVIAVTARKFNDCEGEFVEMDDGAYLCFIHVDDSIKDYRVENKVIPVDVFDAIPDFMGHKVVEDKRSVKLIDFEGFAFGNIDDIDAKAYEFKPYGRYGDNFRHYKNIYADLNFISMVLAGSDRDEHDYTSLNDFV
jgi:hypothetical protein